MFLLQWLMSVYIVYFCGPQYAVGICNVESYLCTCDDSCCDVNNANLEGKLKLCLNGLFQIHAFFTLICLNKLLYM